jgi:hypothetical protein
MIPKLFIYFKHSVGVLTILLELTEQNHILFFLFLFRPKLRLILSSGPSITEVLPSRAPPSAFRTLPTSKMSKRTKRRLKRRLRRQRRSSHSPKATTTTKSSGELRPCIDDRLLGKNEFKIHIQSSLSIRKSILKMQNCKAR